MIERSRREMFAAKRSLPPRSLASHLNRQMINLWISHYLKVYVQLEREHQVYLSVEPLERV
jgi:hypothetical protein